MKNTISVAIIEDDHDLRGVLTKYLQSVGMDVAGFNAVDEFDSSSTTYDVVILDVMLPGENGFVAAARLRSRSMIGLVMLTGRTKQEDKVLGLSIGVDHYLAKPVDLRELESIIRNLARRLGCEKAATYKNPAESYECWILNMEGWRLIAPNGISIDLSRAEYQTLCPILEQPGQPKSRDEINFVLGKRRIDSENRSLDVLISRVKRKVETTTGIQLPLRAARGAGYVFTGVAQIEGSAA